ncbi:helix-hairpin-helix domain-containing protein [Deinococcus sp. KNUC1210]|uniref:DNA polymerase/3'-5' exonuclease PolX n=1 Tax=Deinococcus sp. KNUC1210 TaxID=2917691 RepID=UPI001EF01A8F|nr:DNA polymerase/3'-5' exonuclease PolX [Deinococcus sp. KNUC1210]ULH15604.1 helix-hairpin-helix domain-containing protein [Deinococcus sp. KNUC1210]
MTKPVPQQFDPDTGEIMGHLKALISALKRSADLLDVLGAEEFRANAFRGAARSLEGQDETLETLAAREFRRIPKVGPGIAAELMTYVQTGVFGPLAELEAQLPPGVLSLFRVRGLGPKKIRALWEAGIDSLQTLWEAAQDGRLSKLKGFGVKSAATLSDAAEFALTSQSREFLNTALRLGTQVATLLDGLEPRLSGELRRGLDTVGTVRLTATATATQLRERLDGRLDEVQMVEGKPLLTGRLEGLPVEIGHAAAETRGALDLMFGGGAAYRQATRARAQELGLSLSGRGLKRGPALLETPAEADVLRELGWPELPPEYREDEHWALGAAALAALPPAEALLRVQDLRALLHTHSTWSDGTASIEAMAREAERLDFGADGGCYLGTGDHSGAAHYANGLDAGRLRQQLREVRELQAAGVPLVAGAEVDILEDGSLDYPDELLAQLDYVVVSVHSHFTLPSERQTERLIRAVSHPLTTILGHPTGRLLLRRPSYALDLEAVLEACAAQGTVVEINASPYRLDLDWRVALRWRDRLKFAINTDAHTLGGLTDVQYGVMAARKAGLLPEQVVNTLGRQAFLDFVGAQRAQR